MSRLLAPVLALALGASTLAGCGDDDTSAGSPAPTSESATTTSAAPADGGYAALAEAAVRQVEEGAVLLDVRTQEEWDEGHAAPATHLPLAKIEAGTLPDAPKDAQILIYCRSGNRAGIAADLLRKAGYTDVTNIGGLVHWEAAGGAVSG